MLITVLFSPNSFIQDIWFFIGIYWELCIFLGHVLPKFYEKCKIQFWNVKYDNWQITDACYLKSCLRRIRNQVSFLYLKHLQLLINNKQMLFQCTECGKSSHNLCVKFTCMEVIICSLCMCASFSLHSNRMCVAKHALRAHMESILA